MFFTQMYKFLYFNSWFSAVQTCKDIHSLLISEKCGAIRNLVIYSNCAIIDRLSWQNGLSVNCSI